MKAQLRSAAASVYITIEAIGDILLRKSSRAKHLHLSIRPYDGIQVAVPENVTFEAAEKFVRSKTDWLKKHLPKIQALEAGADRLRQESVMDRKTARGIIVARLQVLAETSGFSYNRVYVRSQKTRWGSCSEKNNINLNIALAYLPRELMDYTIYHELVHTRIKNHGRGFWQELERHVPGARQLDRKLCRYQAVLYLNNP